MGIEKLTLDQQRVLQRLWVGDSMFLTGGAGTGKTSLIRCFVQGRKGVLLFAPTGKAAVNLGGVTLHSFFKASIGIINKSQYLKLRDDPARKIGDANAKVLKAAKTIVIDEVSMCRSDLFEYVMSIIKAAEHNWNKSYQIILTGDFFQLPPIIDSRKGAPQAWIKTQPNNPNGWAFKSPDWKFDLISLSEVVRQTNKDFAEALNLIRIGDKSGLSWIDKHCQHEKPIGNYITIASTNEIVNAANTQKLNALKKQGAPSKKYKLHKPALTSNGVSNRAEKSDWKSVCEELLDVCIGARVMCLCNHIVRNNDDGATIKQEESYYNGETGTVIKLYANSVKVRLDRGDVVDIGRYKWCIYEYEIKNAQIEKITIGEFEQIPLRLAWASTVHKSQGMTYTTPVYIYIDKSSPFFAPGMTYVALSRATKIENLYLSDSLKSSSLLTSSEVQDFYRQTEPQSSKAWKNVSNVVSSGFSGMQCRKKIFVKKGRIRKNARGDIHAVH